MIVKFDSSSNVTFLKFEHSKNASFPISEIDEGIEILTGVPAGKKDKNGKFTAGTINYLAYEKLKKYAKVSYEK